MEIVKIRCESCRNGCLIEAETEDGEVIDVSGNGCMRGYALAQRAAIEAIEKSNNNC